MKKIFILFLLTFCVTACGVSEDEPQIEPPQNSLDIPHAVRDTPSAATELTLSVRTPKTLNPIYNTDVTVDRILHLLFEPLFNVDNGFKLRSNIAVSYEPSADGLSAVIKLDDSKTWSDGAKVTARDFVYTIQAIKTAEESLYKANAENISHVSAIDALTVRVDYFNAKSGQEYLFTFPLIPEHYYRDETDPKSPRNMSPIGNGAYNLIDLKEGEEIIFTGNAPYFNTIRAIITPNIETDIHAFNQSRTDSLTVNYAEWAKFPSTREMRLYEIHTNQYDFLGFNHRKSALTNKDIREAIARALNTDSLIASAYYGMAKKALGPVHPNSWLLAPELNDYTYDPEIIAELLSKYEPLTLNLLVNSENAERQIAAQTLSQNLTAAGAAVIIHTENYDKYLERLENGDFDIALCGYNFSYFPDLAKIFHSEGSHNFFSYKNAVLDQKLEAAGTAIDDLEHYTAIADAQRLINEDCAVVSIAFRSTAHMTNAWIDNLDMLINNPYGYAKTWHP